jgi:hypothetical protein
MKLGIFVLSLMLFIAGCSGLKGRRVTTGDPTANERTAGVSYYLVKPVFSIARKTTREGKPAIPKFELELAWQPDEQRRYEVGMSPGVFTSDSFELQLAPGGSAVALSSKRSDEVGKAVVGAVNLAAEIAKAAAETAAKAPVPAAKGVAPKPTTTRPWEPSCNAVTETPTCPFSQPALLDGKKCIAELKRTLAEEVRQLPQSNPCSEPVGSYRTPTPTPDAALSKRIQSEVTCLEALIAEDPPESLGEKLVGLKAALKKARAAAITDTNIDPSKPELKSASQRMDAALKLVDQRSSFERRDALAKLLKSPATAHAKGYAALSQEFDRIVKEIDDLVPSAEDEPNSDATEVTSTIDKKVFVDQQCKPLSKEELDVRRKLAKARVLSGTADAVVITIPVN